VKVVVEADGGSRGNPGPAGYGAAVLDSVSGATLAERSESIGIATNNVAEYRGLIAGLEAAIELGADGVAVRMDSKLVVEQMSGRWQVKHPDMAALARRASDLRRVIGDVTFQWIPREQNRHADRLANQAMDGAAEGTASTHPARPTQTKVADEAVRPALWIPPVDLTPTRLVIVRHGSTAHSAAKRFSGRNDLGLDDQGRHQAAAAARRVQLDRPVAVVSSPLRRARETAQIIADLIGCVVSVEEGLTETDFGAWEGLTSAEVKQDWPQEYAAWMGSMEIAPPGGESFAQVTRRVRLARGRVIAANPDRTAVVVSHVTPIKTLLRLALDAPSSALYSLHLDTGSISTIDYYADGPSVIRLFNEVPAL
jgi:broad specificity phosphatase PhoE/ribonuclease HI